MLARECSTIRKVYATNAEIRGLKTPWIKGQFLALIVGSLLLTLGYAVKVADILR